MDVCSQSWEDQYDQEDDLHAIVQFGPNSLRVNITNRLADKFLEVCLDVQGMTPDLALEGCKAFAQDLNELMMFGGSSNSKSSSSQEHTLPPFAKRLEDVVNLMSMDTKPLRDLKMALGGLGAGGLSPVLSYTAFSQDGTLMEEAMSMLRAKGFAWIHLEDAISVLNRRDE
uniref:Uncharacterized protein n=1 Tax=Grammatophora oceanica TaxID=210454 RepID=A0A7S1Y6J6_9STRA